MKKIVTSIVSLCAGVAGMMAASYTLCDFESYELGQTLKIWNTYGSTSETSAVIVADPLNANNKVLHITNKSWNDHIEFQLPAEYAGQNFAGKVESVSVRICRHQNDPCGEWKNFQIYLGEEKLHEESFPSYGPVSTWKTWTYEMPAISADNNSAYLRLGFNSDNSEYYIDDIMLNYIDFKVYENGKLNMSNPNSTSSSYTNFDEGINIPAGTELDVYTSRYTYWLSPVRGSGRMNIHSGGERSYIGNNSGKLPDWSGFTGDVHIYGWPEVNTSVKAGFYGEVLGTGGYKFDPGNVKTSIKEGKFSRLFAANKVVLHEGAAMAGEDGNNARAHRIGSLRMEPGSRLMGYYKANKQKGVYYLVGSDGTDSELAGTIAAEGTALVGLVKEGKGTYTISGNDNRITGIVTVVGGRLLVSNDAAAAREKKLAGAIGIGANTTGVMVYAGACLGGSGNISGLTDIYGYLEPGDSNGRTLAVADYAGGKAMDLKLHPTSRLIFNIYGSEDATALDVSGAIMLNPRDEAWDESEAMPILDIRLGENHNLKTGDKFVLISAASKNDDESAGWKFRVQYPTAYTWEVKEESTADGYVVTATVTDTQYSGQGDNVIEDERVLDGDDNSAFIVDWTEDYDDPTPLREYAAKINKSIGVAVPVWKFNLNNASDAKTRTTAEQFNLVVAENEMKIDATEPTQGNFSLGNANTLIDFANRNDMDVRGHTLVWHSQVSNWISEDGKKNNKGWTKSQLLDIMHNHIGGVAGGLKGKIREWDVVNECLDDDQSIVWSNPNGYKLRSSVWKDVIGEEFIADAFRTAHEVDPDALLYLNDYGVEFAGQPKAEAFYNLAKNLVEAGVPIHGVGLQCHVTTGQIDASKLKENIRRYKDLGLKCIITELDIAQADPKDPDAAKRQAADYCAVVMAALSQENCPTVLIWGLADPDSWRENNPLIYDGSVMPKEAYYGVHAALRTLAKRTDLEEIATDAVAAEVIAVEYYNLQGVRLQSPAPGLVIKREYLSDGTVTNTKVIIR